MKLPSDLRGFRLGGVVPFVAWTLFVWGTRFRNAASDEELAGSELVTAYLAAGVFVALGLAVGAVVLLRRRQEVGRLDAVVVGGAAAFTVVYWLIRMVTIALNDHRVGFILVHVVLGLVSILVSAFALRSVGASKNDTGSSIRAWDSP